MNIVIFTLLLYVKNMFWKGENEKVKPNEIQMINKNIINHNLEIKYSVEIYRITDKLSLHIMIIKKIKKILPNSNHMNKVIWIK